MMLSFRAFGRGEDGKWTLVDMNMHIDQLGWHFAEVFSWNGNSWVDNCPPGSCLSANAVRVTDTEGGEVVLVKSCPEDTPIADLSSKLKHLPPHRLRRATL